MDMKYKIIIVVFVAIVFLYVGHFVINYMNKNTRKETFIDDDDVEHYEEPSPKSTPKPNNTSSESKYDMRVLVLDDIEKLNITDKEIKGKLMQNIFGDDEFMKSIENKTAIKRLELIEIKYDALKSVKTTDQESKVKVSNTNESSEKTDDKSKDKFVQKDEPAKEKHSADKELMTKAENALNHLQYVQNGLKDIQAYARSLASNNTSEKKISTKSSFEDLSIPEPFIEGYENVKNYASLL